MWAFGLCVAALAATTCSGWDLNSEYHYEIDAKILHELDKQTHQHAGFLGKSDLILQVKENAILLKVENAKMIAVNERPDPDHQHEHHYQKLPLELEQHIAKPFRINYQHDVLTSIDVAKDDPPWSVNVKKALASRLQLQNINSKNASERNFYTRSEDGPSGECEVDYEIDLDGNNNEIYVTKTKNIEKCKSLSYRYYDNQNLWVSFEGSNLFYKPIQMSETTYTDMTGSREDYYIHWQRTEESITFAPYGLEADYIKGKTDSKITLTEIVPVTEEIKIPDDAVTHHDLHSEFEKPPEIKSAENLKSHPHGLFYFIAQKHSVEKVAEMFERLMTVDDGKKYTEVFHTKPMPFLFMQLYYAMTTLNYDQLKDLHENHVIKEGQPGEEMRIRKFVFGDALVAAGTSSAFMYLKDLMTNGKMPHSVINHLLKQIPMAIQPVCETLLEEFYSLCKHPYIHDNVPNRKVCYLAFSTVVQEQCVSKYHKLQDRYTQTEEEIHCTPEIAEKFFNKVLAEPEVHAQDSFSRILFIKVAGNFGTRGSLEELLKIIQDNRIHQYYRFNAIMSLEHHANLYPQEVLHAMLPIYYSSHVEPQEIRMAAFLYILFSRPKLSHLEAIVENLENEPDHQVAHYVKSSVEQLSQLENPCYQRLIEICKRVSRLLKRLDFKTKYDFRHSFGWYNDGFNRKFQIGGQTNVNYITSNSSYVPQHVYLYLMDYVGRTMKSPLEIGYNGYGLDKVVDNFFGIPRVKNAQAPTVVKELKEFDEKLHIEVREPKPMLADFYLNSFGSTLDFFHLNDTTFEDLAQKDAGQLPALLESMKDVGERSLKRFFVGRQQLFVMPSALGWPYCINTAEVNFAFYRNNQFKLHVDPHLLTGAKNDEAPPTVSVNIDAHVVHDRFLFSFMGTALPVVHLSASAGVMEREYTSLPLKLKIALDPRTPKLMVKYTPILPHTRLHKTFAPITILHNMSNPDPTLNDIGILPYHKKQELKIDENLFHDYLGYGIHLKGSSGPSHILDSWGSLKKFMIENDLRTKLYYLEHNPLAVSYDYEVSLTPASKDQATEIDMEFTFDHWGFDTHSDKSHKPPFPVVKDGHEDYINSRDDRKARTCVAKVDVVSKGAKERKLHIGLGYTHTFDNRYHQVNFNYDRSPFGPEETDHFKICSSSSILFPHVDMQKMHDLDTVDIDPKIDVATDIHFGKNCESDKKITLRGGMVRTEEHQQHQQHRENPEADNLDAKLYQKCKKNIANGHRYSFKCRHYWYRSLKLREYKMDIELENLNAHDKEHLEHLDTCLKHYLYYYLTEHHHEVEHNPNKIHIDANFSATTDHVDIRITKPDETLEFDHVPHPNDVQARSATPFFEFTNKVAKWSYYRFPFCAVEGNTVHTFDDVHYDIPPMDCYKVIAKDCSQGKQFTILDRKVVNNRFHKAIKVFLGNWLIEALPVTADSDILVRINGEHIPVTEEKPHYHYQTHNDKDHLMFTVSYDGLFYKIRSRKYGVIVYFDGNAVVINLSPYYRGKQCGLCGDFNNNDNQEFQGANNCYYKNHTDFSYSYAIPGDGCHVPEIVAPCEHHKP